MSAVRLDEPLSIRQLEVFVALVDQGSFTEAARHLGLSQSTVSGHVADLERRLSAQVVERSRRGVRPTAAGEALLEPARQTLSAERSSRQAVAELTGLLRGRLVIGASTIPAAYVVPRLCARFREHHPDVALRIVTGDSRSVVENVLAADVDLGVVGALPDPSSVHAEPVGEDRLVLILPADHPFAEREFLTAADVTAQPHVLREEGSGQRDAALALLQEAGEDVTPSALTVALEVGSTEACKAAVREGLGLAFVSDLAVRDELASGALASVPVEGFDVPRTLHLVTREQAYLSPAARAFCELVHA